SRACWTDVTGELLAETAGLREILSGAGKLEGPVERSRHVADYGRAGDDLGSEQRAGVIEMEPGDPCRDSAGVEEPEVELRQAFTEGSGSPRPVQVPDVLTCGDVVRRDPVPAASLVVRQRDAHHPHPP